MAVLPTTIYVDLDDVLCGHSCGLTPGERAELYRLVHRPEELLRMAPIAEAIDVLRRWHEEGFDIAIVTGRPPESYEVSLAWLAKHEIPHSSLTVVDKYSRFATENTKAITLAELSTRQFCWAVEDSLPMAQFLAGQMKLPVALIDCPWNQSDVQHERINRFRDWRSVAKAASDLALSDRR
jgi:uncharacterized HAD superfamily protein